MEEFDAPVNNQVHLEQIVTGEMTLNIVEHPAVQEQVTVHEIPQVLERIQEQTEEQIVHVSAPPIVDDTAEVVPIVPGCPLPQTREESSDILRFQKLLLNSVAVLGRLQSSASSLDQRITEHERLIHENRVPEQMADQIQHAPKKKAEKGQTQKVEMKFVWAAMIPHLLPGGRRRENAALIRCNSFASYARRLRRDCWLRGTERPARLCLVRRQRG